MHFITKLIRKILFGNKASSDDYITSLKSKGAEIGTGVKIYSPNHTFIDEMFPFMLSIGNNVNITSGVHILNHDYFWSVLKLKYNMVLGGVGKVSIGNNVFIGVNSIILMNTEIGDNVIVGAGSVVHGKIPSNCVVAGSPARIICSIEDFFERRKKRQYTEAVQIVKAYRDRFGKNPPKECLPAYFFLFEPRKDFTNSVFVSRLKLSGNYEESLNEFMNSLPMFESYETFLKSID